MGKLLAYINMVLLVFVAIKCCEFFENHRFKYTFYSWWIVNTICWIEEIALCWAFSMTNKNCYPPKHIKPRYCFIWILLVMVTEIVKSFPQRIPDVWQMTYTPAGFASSYDETQILVNCINFTILIFILQDSTYDETIWQSSSNITNRIIVNNGRLCAFLSFIW